MRDADLAAYAERIAAEAPPLTAAQCDRLALLLNPTNPDGGAGHG